LKKSLAALLVTAAAVAALAVPAGAASWRHQTFRCAPHSRRTVEVRAVGPRHDTHVQNNCKTQWLVAYVAPSEGQSDVRSWYVGPGAHALLSGGYSWTVVATMPECTPGGSAVYVRGSHGQNVYSQYC
jgi:hypothetical protein